MDSDQATFSCGFNSGMRLPDYIQFSSEPELQITSDAGLVQCKGNPYRTIPVCHPRLGMGFQFRRWVTMGRKGGLITI